MNDIVQQQSTYRVSTQKENARTGNVAATTGT